MKRHGLISPKTYPIRVVDNLNVDTVESEFDPLDLALVSYKKTNHDRHWDAGSSLIVML